MPPSVAARISEQHDRQPIVDASDLVTRVNAERSSNRDSLGKKLLQNLRVGAACAPIAAARPLATQPDLLGRVPGALSMREEPGSDDDEMPHHVNDSQRDSSATGTISVDHGYPHGKVTLLR